MSEINSMAREPSPNNSGCSTPGGFRGPHAFLSNFHPCPVQLDGFNFRCSEAAYMAQKTLDPSIRAQFQDFDGPTAKREGTALMLRPDWAEVRIEAMRRAIRAKFTQNCELADLLVGTGEGQLVEINAWNDHFWGVCNGEGENWLGRILMEIRAELGRATV